MVPNQVLMIFRMRIVISRNYPACSHLARLTDSVQYLLQGYGLRDLKPANLAGLFLRVEIVSP